VLIHFVAPHGKLLQRLLALEQLLGSLPPLLTSHQHAGPREPQYGIPSEEWPNVVRRVSEHHQSLRQVAAGDARVPRNGQAYPSYFSQPPSRIGGFSFPCLFLGPYLSMQRPDSRGPSSEVGPSLWGGPTKVEPAHYREIVAEEGGRNTERTWAKGGKRRSAGSAGRSFVNALRLPSRQKRCAFPLPGTSDIEVNRIAQDDHLSFLSSLLLLSPLSLPA
jgi:hypothetical protein